MSASPAVPSAAVPSAIPDALCPPVVVFARHRLRDEAWRRTTLAAVAATELALVLLAGAASVLLIPLGVAAMRPYSGLWMVAQPEGWAVESPFFRTQLAMLAVGALVLPVALAVPLVWAEQIRRSWARTRSELVDFVAPWTLPIPDPRWTGIEARLLALRGPDPVSERAEVAGRLALACAVRLRRDPTSDDLDAVIVALAQLGSAPNDTHPAAVRALLDRLEASRPMPVPSHGIMGEPDRPERP